MEAALLAEYFCNLQPLHVRNRLLHDEKLGAHFGLASRMVITIGGDMHVEQQELFVAARRALAGQGAESFMSVDGHETFVKVDQGRVLLESPSKERKIQLDELMILSPNQEERTRTLRRLIDLWGPTAPDFSALLANAVECELNDEEVGKLFTERASGVAALQSRAAAAFSTDQVTLENLVPESLAYFERFCGPHPGDAEHEEYFRTVLPHYRKDLIRRDLVRGLDICLQGALRDDLMPGAWTEYLNDNELWEALVVCDPWRDPFALLGALDIALGRQHDERYQQFAEAAVKKLVQEEFPRPDELDTYELLPLLAELVLNRLNTLEGGALRPPCWKRMCAWMQAGFLGRLTQHLRLDLASLREWIGRTQTPAGMYTNILDLRHEPMYRAATMSRQAFREEIIGRLVLVRERHKTAGRIVPSSDSIHEAVSRLAEDSLPLSWMLPGPLDGHLRPCETGTRRLPEDDFKRAAEELANNLATPVLSLLAHLSQYFDLSGELLVRIRGAITQIASVSEAMSEDAPIGRLADAALIACAQRDMELASAIASTAIATAHWAHSDAHVRSILQTLLIAGASFASEDEWAEWLERHLAEAAIRLPTGEPSKMFLARLQELKKVLKLNLGIHIRAEALASAAD